MTKQSVFFYILFLDLHRQQNAHLMAPMADGASFGGGASGASGGKIGGLAAPSRTRTNFPETWLWLNKTTR